MKRAGCIFALAIVCLAIGLVVYPVYKVSFIKWPTIKNPEEFIQACEGLLKSYPKPTDVPKDEWPSAISEINPRYVFVDGTYVKITVSSGGIGDSWGLIVTGSDSEEEPPAYAIETKSDQIYRFK